METMDEKIKNVVLGAGISGLAFACESGGDTVVFEKEDSFGGLCGSFEVEGFFFDKAVHLSFTEIREAREYFDKTPTISHKPNPYCFYNSIWIKHPVIFNMSELPVCEKVGFLQSFVEEKHEGKVLNYEDWLRASYGRAITEKLYSVYTRKYWTSEPRDLSTSWIGGRINVPDLRKMLTGAFEKDTGNDYYASEMRYPTEGKFESFLKPMAEKAEIRYRKEAVRINAKKKKVYFSDGTSVCYENLISSVPLPELTAMIEDVPERIISLSYKLKASSVSIVSIGLNRPDAAKWLWFYIYDENLLAARVNSPSLKSRANSPDGTCSLQFEIYHSHGSDVDSEAVIRNVKQSLLDMKICSQEDLLFMDCRQIPFGNVIFNIGMEEARDRIKSYMKEKGITLIGRFGEWDYLWSDQSYLSGKRAAENLTR